MADSKFPLLSQTLEGEKEYSDLSIPTFDELKDIYGRKWQKEKRSFKHKLNVIFLLW